MFDTVNDTLQIIRCVEMPGTLSWPFSRLSRGKRDRVRDRRALREAKRRGPGSEGRDARESLNRADRSGQHAKIFGYQLKLRSRISARRKEPGSLKLLNVCRRGPREALTPAGEEFEEGPRYRDRGPLLLRSLNTVAHHGRHRLSIFSRKCFRWKLSGYAWPRINQPPSSCELTGQR